MKLRTAIAVVLSTAGSMANVGISGTMPLRAGARSTYAGDPDR